MKQNSSQNKISIGLGIFKPDTPKDLLQIACQINKEQKKKNLLKHSWLIIFGLYHTNRWEELFEQMYECKCVEISLSLNAQQKILRSFVLPIFTHLRILSLESADLRSIEPLTFLNAELLEELNICQNYISSLSALSKSKWNILKILRVRDNEFSQCNLGRIKMFNKLDFIRLQEDGQKQIVQDISVLVKMECAYAKMIKIESQDRIYQERVLRAIKNKKYNTRILTKEGQFDREEWEQSVEESEDDDYRRSWFGHEDEELSDQQEEEESSKKMQQAPQKNQLQLPQEDNSDQKAQAEQQKSNLQQGYNDGKKPVERRKKPKPKSRNKNCKLNYNKEDSAPDSDQPDLFG